MVIKSHTPELLYYMAEDYLELDAIERYQIGVKLGLLTTEDYYSTQSIIDSLIFYRMWHWNKFQDFCTLLYKVKDGTVILNGRK